jgi:hypothetical protein
VLRYENAVCSEEGENGIGVQENIRAKKDHKNTIFGGALAGAYIGIQRKSMHAVVISSVALGLGALVTSFM